jgi:Zn finger protein HypA/HybF involved in hydrogenase expression
MHTEIQKAYLAGFFDGDGHVQLGLLGQKSGHRQSRHTLNVNITNTHLGVLESIQAEWPTGKIYHRNRAPDKGWKTAHNLRWTTAAAAEVLREIRPYLRVKHKQADVAIQFANSLRTGDRSLITPKEWEWREDLRMQVRALNRRGGDAPAQRVLIPKEKPSLTCQYCGTEFNSYQYRRKYCGQKCRMQAGREAYIDRHTYQRTCPACQREFTARLKQIYCSVKCSSRHAYTRRDYKKTVIGNQ